MVFQVTKCIFHGSSKFVHSLRERSSFAFIILIGVKRFQEVCVQTEWMKGNCYRILHILFSEFIVHGSYMLEYYEHLKKTDDRLLQYYSVTRFFKFLKKQKKRNGNFKSPPFCFDETVCA